MANKSKKISEDKIIEDVDQDSTESIVVKELEAEKKAQFNEKINSEEKAVDTKVADMMEAMMKKIQSLEKEIENNKQQQSAQVTSFVNPNLLKRIAVISLLPHILNLSTDPYNKVDKGSKYKFEYFGHEIQIPYDDLHKIVVSNNRFITDGMCYILDPDFVKSEKLEKQYEKLVDKNTFDRLLKADIETFKKVYNSMIDSQKEILRSVFISKINKGEQFDMNIISFIDSGIENENKKLMTAINNYNRKDDDEDK